MSTTNSTTPKPSRFATRAPAPKRGRGRPPAQPLPPLRKKDRARAELARLAIDWPRVVLEDMAEDCNTTRSSMNAYRTGQRRMPNSVALQLAQWLRNRAVDAVVVAEQLEEAVRKNPDP